MRLNTLLTAIVLTLFVAQNPLLRADTHPVTAAPLDSDHDGLSDELEQSLLIQFTPKFMIGTYECANIPAEFEPQIKTPKVVAENSTIYGQAFPASTSNADERTVELHYYHLWKIDCGPHGHALDTEHVSVLVHTSDSKHWKAVYWYAAAHEATVCDVSQISRASTLKAEDHGATIWISPGKHASYLNPTLCHTGCGADHCDEMKPLAVNQIINLGELNAPMNGSIWTSSPQWPLSVKMSTTDFSAAPVARLEALPATDIAWVNPGHHPAQGVIAVSGTTANALGTSGDNTATAISLARDSTGGALSKSYHKTAHALGISAHHVHDALTPKPKPDSK